MSQPKEVGASLKERCWEYSLGYPESYAGLGFPHVVLVNESNYPLVNSVTRLLATAGRLKIAGDLNFNF
jgi:hypothetical protein